jgi:DNA polymerase III delta subunit
MGNYSQWVTARKLSKLIWLYGPEKALIEEIREFTKSQVGASDLDSFSFNASSDSESEIWDTLYTRSLSDNSTRLVEIINSESLKNTDRLDEWISSYSKYSPETTLLMLADAEPTLPKIKAPRAVVVRCVMPKPEDRLKWVMQQGNLSESSAKALLTHKNGDLLGCRDVCRKLRTLLPDMESIEVSSDTISSIDDETPCDFSSSLLERDKTSAFDAASSVPVDGVSKVLSSLDYSLTLIDRLKDILDSTPRGQKLENIPGFPMGRLSELIPLARSYSLQDIVRCKQILSIVESHHRRGIQEGILESLTSMW